MNSRPSLQIYALQIYEVFFRADEFNKKHENKTTRLFWVVISLNSSRESPLGRHEIHNTKVTKDQLREKENMGLPWKLNKVRS